MKISNEVQYALKNNIPVVALESTIISHGMPYPKNVETALLVEKTIRDNGAIPATIGIIDGEAIVGMNPEEIEEFGKRKGIKKVSRRDLPIVYAKKLWGATTVAATMILAAQAGIEIFVTGGIGGAHRKANETFDISADLEELGKTNVSVVSAGVKAILDLKLTLEILETKGVPVLSYQTDEFADFYTRHSGIKMENVVNTPLEVAQIIKAKRGNHLDGGVLIANPIPEEDEMDPTIINNAIEVALANAEKDGISGKDITPYLLKTIVELTNGDSLESNIKLVLNNAKLGAKIAKELTRL
ncbi:MAG: pseudouridine-5'-phosphate glycosidase [Erysipelotrichaceae bacterium]|nr:pseudouridine-5'-phosphate glycosidase [Erysipelotrichaceae bacterium]